MNLITVAPLSSLVSEDGLTKRVLSEQASHPVDNLEPKVCYVECLVKFVTFKSHDPTPLGRGNPVAFRFQLPVSGMHVRS